MFDAILFIGLFHPSSIFTILRKKEKKNSFPQPLVWFKIMKRENPQGLATAVFESYAFLWQNPWGTIKYSQKTMGRFGAVCVDQLLVMWNYTPFRIQAIVSNHGHPFTGIRLHVFRRSSHSLTPTVKQDLTFAYQ